MIPQVIIDDQLDPTKIYFITLATDDEILLNEYIQLGTLKISKNPKKCGVIENIKFSDKSDEVE